MKDSTAKSDLFSKAYDKAQEAIDSMVEDPTKPLPIDCAAGFLVSTASICYVSYGAEATENLFQYVKEAIDKVDATTDGDEEEDSE